MTLKNFKFNVIENDKFARTGIIETHRGIGYSLIE